MYIYDLYLPKFFLEEEMFWTIVVKKIKTRILCSITFFPRNHAVYEIMLKNMVGHRQQHNAVQKMFDLHVR